MHDTTVFADLSQMVTRPDLALRCPAIVQDAWMHLKEGQRRADDSTARIDRTQADRLARMPSHWPSHWPAERPEAPTEIPGATPPRRSEPPLHEVLARLAPSVTRAVARHRIQKAAQ